MPKTTIFIGTDYDGRGVVEAQKSLVELSKNAGEFVNSIKAGVGIDLGGRLVNSLAQIPAILQQGIARGVEFNVKMGDAETAIANVVQKFGGLDSVAAKNTAAKAMAQIVELEPKAAGTLDTLVSGFMATLAASQAAGMSVEQNIDLVGRFANALANSNIPAEQLAQEMRSILSGNIGADSQLARQLGITNEEVNKAKQLGTTYEFLRDKIGALGQAGDTFAVRMSSMQSAIDKALGAITKPISDALFESLKTLADEINRPDVASGLKQLGFEVGNVVRSGADLLEWAVRNAAALSAVAHGAATLGAALAAIGIARVVIGMGAWAASLVNGRVVAEMQATAVARATAAVQAETAALGANTAAQAANATARGGAAGATAAGAATRAGGLRGAIGGLGVAGAANLALAGVGIGAAIYAHRTQKAGEALADAQSNDALVDSLARQRQLLETQVREATTMETKAAARKAIEEEIVQVRQQMNRLDEDGQKIAERGIFNLNHLLNRTEKLAGTKALSASENWYGDPKNLAASDAARSKEIARKAAWEKEFEAAETDALPDEQRLAKLRDRAVSVRASFADDLSQGKGIDLNPGFTARDARQAIGGMTDSEAAASFTERLKEIMALEKEIAALSAKTGEELNKNLEAQADMGRQRAENLRDAQDEHAIMAAHLSGNEKLAGQLEAQRDYRKEIDALSKAGILDAQTQAAAQQALNDKLAQQGQAQRKLVEEQQAANNVAAAENGGSKSKLIDAKVTEARLKQANELKAAGVDPEQARRLSDDAGEQLRRKLRREAGIIGGSASRSDRDSLGSGIDNLNRGPSDDFRKAFGGAPLGDLIPTRPANAPAVNPPAPGAAAPGAPVAAAAKQVSGQVAATGSEVAAAMAGVGAQVEAAKAAIVTQINGLTGRMTELENVVSNLRGY